MKKNISANVRLLYGIIPIIPILVFLVITDSFYSDINELKKDYSNNIMQLKLQKEDTIRSIIYNRISLAKIQNDSVKKNLIEEVNKEYGSLDAVADDIYSSTITPKMFKIYSRIILKDRGLSRMYDVIEPDHILFISNKTGILSITEDINPHKPYHSFRSWNDVMNTKLNKKITENAINSILAVSDYPILWESDFATMNRYVLEAMYDLNKDMLENVIGKDSDYAFKSFCILVPCYVSLAGHPYDVIIIREINMFNIIEPYMFYLHRFNTMIEEYKFDMSRLIFFKILACIIIAMALFCSFFLALCSTLERIKEKR